LIGDAGSKEHADEIMSCLDSDQDIVKIAAARALSKLGYRDAIPAIDSLRGDKNQDIVEAAEQAISVLQEVK
ncbi:MAG: HEAT repeat domain-containing protein, partial [candidate division Zixibacteria bacterium]|nr:HEAT repeat domain-containing protein [candidate division Zixibacteria bacterium]